MFLEAPTSNDEENLLGSSDPMVLLGLLKHHPELEAKVGVALAKLNRELVQLNYWQWGKLLSE